MYQQTYNPLGNVFLSTVVAAITRRREGQGGHGQRGPGQGMHDVTLHQELAGGCAGTRCQPPGQEGT